MSPNPACGEVYSIYYVRKFVSNFWQVDGFSGHNPDCSPNKTDSHDIGDIVLKVALNTIPVIVLIQFPSLSNSGCSIPSLFKYIFKNILSFSSFSLDSKQLINLQLQGMVQNCKSENMKHWLLTTHFDDK